MPKQKPENKLSDKEQFKRFKAKAKELGVKTDADSIERQFNTLAERAREQKSEQGQ